MVASTVQGFYGVHFSLEVMLIEIFCLVFLGMIFSICSFLFRIENSYEKILI